MFIAQRANHGDSLDFVDSDVAARPCCARKASKTAKHTWPVHKPKGASMVSSRLNFGLIRVGMGAANKTNTSLNRAPGGVSFDNGRTLYHYLKKNLNASRLLSIPHTVYQSQEHVVIL